MIRFMLRLVGALLVEKLLRGKRRPTYKYALLQHPSARDWFEGECMVGVSGTTPSGVVVSTPLFPEGYVEREGNGPNETTA